MKAKQILIIIGKALLFIIVYIAGRIIGSNLGSMVANLINPKDLITFDIAGLIGNIFPAITVLLFSHFVLKLKPEDLWLKHPKPGLKYLIGFLVGGLLFGSYMLFAVLSKQLTYAGRGELRVLQMLAYLPAFAIQSFEEELLTRGFLQRIIKDKWGVIPSIILPSLIFVVLHLMNPGISVFAMVNIFLVGVLFSLMVYATGSLWLAAAAHGAWNFLQGPIFGQSVSGNSQTISFLRFEATGNNDLVLGGKFGPEGSLVTVIILLVGVGYYFWQWRRQTEATPQEMATIKPDETDVA